MANVPIQGPINLRLNSIRLSVLNRQRMLIRDAANGLGFMATVGLTQAFAAAVNEVGATTSKQMLALGQVFSRVSTDTKRRTEIHRLIAERARESTIHSYSALVTGREGPASRTHYRAGASRFAAGKMLDALRAPGFVVAGPDGINFANTAILDRIAAQWHRLNFGAAGGRQGAGSEVFEVSFNGLVVAAFGFTEPPSPGFALPRGFFTTPSGEVVRSGKNPPGSDVFTPSGGRGPFGGRLTGGILAKHFLDAGMRTIAREMGPMYLGYYDQIFEEAKQGKGPLRGTDVTVRTRAPRLSVSSYRL